MFQRRSHGILKDQADMVGLDRLKSLEFDQVVGWQVQPGALAKQLMLLIEECQRKGNWPGENALLKV